jgi:hypothetical protein
VLENERLQRAAADLARAARRTASPSPHSAAAAAAAAAAGAVTAVQGPGVLSGGGGGGSGVTVSPASTVSAAASAVSPVQTPRSQRPLRAGPDATAADARSEARPAPKAFFAAAVPPAPSPAACVFVVRGLALPRTDRFASRAADDLTVHRAPRLLLLRCPHPRPIQRDV